MVRIFKNVLQFALPLFSLIFWVSLFMYSKDFTCVLLVLHSKECSLEAFHYSVSTWLFKYNFYEEGIWKVWGKQEWTLFCPFWHSENTEKFHSVSDACLLPSLLKVLWISLVLPLSHTELVTGFFLLWASCSPNCEVVNKAMSKGEVKKEVNAWKKHEDKQ